MATKTDCIWNRDLADFPNCCIWQYKECLGKCESYDQQSTGILKPLVPVCVECIDEEDVLP